MKLFKKAKKGFTLVELVVVIAVIAILAAVSVGAYFGVTESAKNSQAAQEGKAVHTNIVLIGNDPANDSGVTFSKDGIKITNFAAFETELEEAVGAVEYRIVNNTADSTETEYDAKLEFKGTGNVYTEFSYTFDDGAHIAYFDIRTGEQLKAFSA